MGNGVFQLVEANLLQDLHEVLNVNGALELEANVAYLVVDMLSEFSILFQHLVHLHKHPSAPIAQRHDVRAALCVAMGWNERFSSHDWARPYFCDAFHCVDAVLC